MSLSSFLLPGADKGKAKAIDTGLDDLFRANASVSPSSLLGGNLVTRQKAPASARTDQHASQVPVPSSGDRKRKGTQETPSGKSKRSKVAIEGMYIEPVVSFFV